MTCAPPDTVHIANNLVFPRLLSGNDLSRVPDFANCSFLGVLHLHDNPIGNMPNNVLEHNYELTDL